MNHGLTNDFLCTASKIEVHFEDDIGTKKTFSGTAFFVKNSKHEICLVTNRHVVDIDYKKKTPKYKNFKIKQVIISNNEKDSEGLPTKSNKIIITNHTDFKFSEKYENDVACLSNISGINLTGSGLKVNYWLDYELIADTIKINEKLVVCDLVAFPGFPADWYDKKNNLPILRTGTIASDPRLDYSFTGSDDGECIAYEAFSYGGSSGSPVFAIQKGIKVGGGLSGGGYREIMLVGINAGHLPIKGLIETHSGISYFYKSSIILEILNKSM